MTDIPLQFAIKCLGWYEASRHKAYNSHARIKPTADPYIGKSFIYDDKRKVLSLVKEWCTKNKKPLEIELIEGEWFVRCGLKQGVSSKDLRLALMSACIKAAE